MLYVLEECKKLYPQFYVMLYTFFGTGAREGEIFALTKQDFNYKEKTLRINKQFTKRTLVFKPKTDASNRIIYIFDDLADILNEYIKTLDINNLLLFPNKSGNYYNACNIRSRFWCPLLKHCGITKRVRLHDIRGSYVDTTLSQGLSVKFAQNQLGHAKSETTLNIYARNNADMIQNAQVKLNMIFKKN